ncbi:hypothetical protein EHS25_005922 [Saitozyma podzolica]|uniref:Uncharacterized protein n=1 Tax=Saitozyma podzolica TaxID=1890683 RepID=A0A427XTI3_9TREE|nr:hypothetical protein EHS25_005922 [Saitozyma podzolica]
MSPPLPRDATLTTADRVSGTATSSGSTTSSTFGTSKIVRTAVAAGVIVLGLTALVLFFKISQWIRYRQRLRRQHALTTSLQTEQRANAYEIAAWADEPGQAPVRVEQSRWGRWTQGGGSKAARKGRKEAGKKSEGRMKRVGANAYAVIEWEGVPQ